MRTSIYDISSSKIKKWRNSHSNQLFFGLSIILEISPPNMKGVPWVYTGSILNSSKISPAMLPIITSLEKYFFRKFIFFVHYCQKIPSKCMEATAISMIVHNFILLTTWRYVFGHAKNDYKAFFRQNCWVQHHLLTYLLCKTFLLMNYVDFFMAANFSINFLIYISYTLMYFNYVGYYFVPTPPNEAKSSKMFSCKS